MPSKKESIEYVIQTAVHKFDEAENIFNTLYPHGWKTQRQRFIALNLLDAMLTLMTPGQLAEYRKWRGK